MKKFLWLSLMAAFFLSCNIEKRITRKADKATRFLVDNQKLAEACVLYFPAKDSIVTRDSIVRDTLFKPGEIKYVLDTVYEDGKPILIHKPCPQCPPNEIHRTTIYKDTVIYKTDVYQVAALETKLAKVTTDLAITMDNEKEAKQGRSKWRLWCLLTWGLIALGIVGKILITKKPF